MIRSQKIVVAAATGVFLCELAAVVLLSPRFGNEVDAAEGLTAETVSVCKPLPVAGDSPVTDSAETNATLGANRRQLTRPPMK